MLSEQTKIIRLFSNLITQPINPFPQQREQLNAPSEPGVYIIRKERIVLHVGRTVRGKRGLYQRLNNHLRGQSSFVQDYLSGNFNTLRNAEYTYQCLVVLDDRIRALLEAYAIGSLCPQHIGLGI